MMWIWKTETRRVYETVNGICLWYLDFFKSFWQVVSVKCVGFINFVLGHGHYSSLKWVFQVLFLVFVETLGHWSNFFKCEGLTKWFALREVVRFSDFKCNKLWWITVWIHQFSPFCIKKDFLFLKAKFIIRICWLRQFRKVCSSMS